MKKILIILTALALIGLAYWLVSPLFIDTEVQEELAVTLGNQNQEDDVQSEATYEPQYNDELPLVEADTSATAPTVTTQEEAITPTVQSSEVISGIFTDADSAHRASGTVYISGSNLSLADLDSTAVPDGFVYLSNDLNAQDSVRIAKLKGNKGNQNYVLPEGVDVNNYKYVLIWCRAFSVLVGSAEIH